MDRQLEPLTWRVLRALQTTAVGLRPAEIERRFGCTTPAQANAIYDTILELNMVESEPLVAFAEGRATLTMEGRAFLAVHLR